MDRDEVLIKIEEARVNNATALSLARNGLT